MKDPYCQRSVIYVCEHNDDEAMNLMINSPIDITVGKMLKQTAQTQIKASSLEKPVLNSGYVSGDKGFILHQPKNHYESSIRMKDSISVTTSKDMLAVLGTEEESTEYIVALGYSDCKPE